MKKAFPTWRREGLFEEAKQSSNRYDIPSQLRIFDFFPTQTAILLVVI